MVQIVSIQCFPGMSLVKWFSLPNKLSIGLNLYKALVRESPLICRWITWCVGNGWHIRIGLDSWYVASNEYHLLTPSIHAPYHQNISFLADGKAQDP